VQLFTPVDVMNRAASTLLAFLLTPVFSTFVLAGVLPVLDGSSPRYGLMPIIWLISVAALCVLGLPVFALLLHRNLIRWWSAALSGLMVGGIVPIVLKLPHFTFENSIQLVPLLVGVASGLFFWAVFRTGRP
jgi:hypothetical protein